MDHIARIEDDGITYFVSIKTDTAIASSFYLLLSPRNIRDTDAFGDLIIRAI